MLNGSRIAASERLGSMQRIPAADTDVSRAAMHDGVGIPIAEMSTHSQEAPRRWVRPSPISQCPEVATIYAVSGTSASKSDLVDVRSRFKAVGLKIDVLDKCFVLLAANHHGHVDGEYAFFTFWNQTEPTTRLHPPTQLCCNITPRGTLPSLTALLNGYRGIVLAIDPNLRRKPSRHRPFLGATSATPKQNSTQ